MPSTFLDELLPLPEPPDARYIWGTVTQTSPLRIKIDGDAAALPITPDDMGTSARLVGQRVYCQIINRRLVVMGPSGPGGLLTLSTQDLNTVQTPGDYRQPLSAQATQARNYPTNIAGLLEVFADASLASMIWQRYSGYGPYAGRVWQRGCYNGTWTAWSIVGFPVASTNLSWTSNFATYSGSTGPVAMRDGYVVSVDGTATPASNSVGTSISAIATLPAFTLPTGYTPVRGSNILCQGSSYDKFDITVGPTGTVAFGRYGPSTAAAGTWMPFQFTFITADPMPGSFV